MDRTLVLQIKGRDLRLRLFDMAKRGKSGVVINWIDPKSQMQYGVTTEPGESVADALSRLSDLIASSIR